MITVTMTAITGSSRPGAIYLKGGWWNKLINKCMESDRCWSKYLSVDQYLLCERVCVCVSLIHSLSLNTRKYKASELVALIAIWWSFGDHLVIIWLHWYDEGPIFVSLAKRRGRESQAFLLERGLMKWTDQQVYGKWSKYLSVHQYLSAWAEMISLSLL